MRPKSIRRRLQLSKDHRTVVGYVAGQPFPLIDANDPDVATKVVWNNVFRPIQSDDYDLRYFDCDTVYTGYNKPFFEIAYGQLGHYAGYDLVGRTEVEPLPIDPDFKNDQPPVAVPARARARAPGRSRHQPAALSLRRADVMATIRGPGRPARGACAV